jgi:hypothetical protein
MKRAIPLLLGLLMAAGAEDLTTTEGRVYKNVTVRKVEPDGLSISHESGLAKIPFTKLPKEVQEKHGYDPAKGKAYAEEQGKKQAAAEAAIDRELNRQAREKAEAEPEEDTDEPAGKAARQEKPGRLELGKKTKKLPIRGRVLQVLPEGLLFSGGGAPWLLKGHPQFATMADGAEINCFVEQEAGTFRYTDVSGAQRTVRIYRYAGKRYGK